MSGAHFTQRDPLHDLTPFTNIARHLILQQHALPVTVFGIGNRYCRHQLTGVQVLQVLNTAADQSRRFAPDTSPPRDG